MYIIRKLLRKRTRVVSFLGSEIRRWHAAAEEVEQIGKHKTIEPVFAVYRKKHAYTDYDAIDRRAPLPQSAYEDLILSQAGFASNSRRNLLCVHDCGISIWRNFAFHVSEKPGTD